MGTMKSRDGGRSSGTQAIDRALQVLSSFITQPEQGITELAKSADLSPSTVHRIVQALVNGGFLDQDPATERYHLGHTAVVLGQSARESLGLERALPVLERLGGETGESVNLGVRDGAEVLVVLRVESVQPLRLDQPPGTRIDIHCSSMGKSLLAFGDDNLDNLTFTPHTASTIVSPGVLATELEVTRERGYSLDLEESIEGLSCIATPILKRDGEAAAAIAIQAPTVRMTQQRQEHLTRRLMAAAHEISDMLFPSATAN